MQPARKVGGDARRAGCGSGAMLGFALRSCRSMIGQSGHSRAPIRSDAWLRSMLLSLDDRAIGAQPCPDWERCLASLHSCRTMIVHNRGIVMPRLGAMLLYERKRKSPETSKLVSGLFRLCSCTIMRATRFELATFWSVARRSIQLSYARISVSLKRKCYITEEKGKCQA